MISGFDLFSAAGAVIDCGNHELHSSVSDNLPTPIRHPFYLFFLRAAESYLLPPHSAVTVTLSINTVGDCPLSLLEPVADVLLREGVVTPFSVPDAPCSCVLIQVRNLSVDPHVSPGGAPLAKLCTPHIEYMTTPF